MSAVPPFRVEWRSNLSARWSLLKAVPTREEADRLAMQQLRGGFIGYFRIVEQRVVASSLTPREIPTDHEEPTSSFGVEVRINGRTVGRWTSMGEVDEGRRP